MLPRTPRPGRPVEPLLTPMIDVVFLLLTFFLITLKIVRPEGDFQVNMPQPVAAPTPLVQDALPIYIRLRATADGKLADICLGDRSLSDDFGALRSAMRRLTDDGSASARQTCVRLDCDYQLRYEYLVAAITAVSGYVERDRIVALVDGIELAPPRHPG